MLPVEKRMGSFILGVLFSLKNLMFLGPHPYCRRTQAARPLGGSASVLFRDLRSDHPTERPPRFGRVQDSSGKWGRNPFQD